MANLAKATSVTAHQNTIVSAKKNDPYPTYTVGGHIYSRVNPNLPEGVEKVATWAAEKGARLQASIDKSTEARVYKQAVLDRRIKPFTENDFSNDELHSLARAIVRSQADGRQTIQRQDYTGDDKKNDGPFRYVIGRSKYTINKNGDAVISDTYDFNNYEKGSGKEDAYITPVIGDTAAWLGRRALPAGVRNVPVSITIPKDMLEKALASGAKK